MYFFATVISVCPVSASWYAPDISHCERAKNVAANCHGYSIYVSPGPY